jgi:hypothetical protein
MSGCGASFKRRRLPAARHSGSKRNFEGNINESQRERVCKMHPQVYAPRFGESVAKNPGVRQQQTPLGQAHRGEER